MQNTEEKRSKTKKLIICISTVLLCVLSVILYYGKSLGLPDWNDVFVAFGLKADLNEDLSVCFVSVGTADAIYIHQGDTDVLIDTGTEKSYESLDSFLKRYDCSSFDAVIVSHPDADHIGGMPDIIENYGTQTLYMYNYSEKLLPDTDKYVNFVNSVKENKVNTIYLSSADEKQRCFSIGEMKFEVMSPYSEYSDTNDTSLVLKMRYGENSFLFTGDAGIDVEEDLLSSGYDLKSDVLKVAHHGSKNSNSEEFLKVVSPKISVISVGSENTYLPDFEVESRLADISELYVTLNDGNIVIKSDGKTLDVQTHV